MKLGYSKECINPKYPVELSGYGYYLGRLTDTILDDIFVRTLYLEEGNERFLLINCDLLTLCPYLVYQVKLALSNRLGLQTKQILLLSTHTHTAPSAAQTIGCGEVSWAYIEFLKEKLTETGLRAADRLHPVRGIRSGQKEINPIGYNRANADGPLDKNVYAVCFELQDSRPYALVSHACHPVTLGPVHVVSPDYPGEVTAALEKGGYEGMFVNGFCGDIDPAINQKAWGSGTKETIREYGTRIAEAAFEIKRMGAQQPLTLRTCEHSFQLPLKKQNDIEINESIQAMLQNETENSPLRVAAEEWTTRMKWAIMDLPQLEQSVTVQAAQIGTVCIVGVQGEIYTQIGLDVRAMLKGTPLLLCGNANAALRYIATDEEISAKSYGGFSSNIVYGSLPAPPGTARLFSEQIAGAIRKLKSSSTPIPKRK